MLSSLLCASYSKYFLAITPAEIRSQNYQSSTYSRRSINSNPRLDCNLNLKIGEEYDDDEGYITYAFAALERSIGQGIRSALVTKSALLGTDPRGHASNCLIVGKTEHEHLMSRSLCHKHDEDVKRNTDGKKSGEVNWKVVVWDDEAKKSIAFVDAFYDDYPRNEYVRINQRNLIGNTADPKPSCSS